MSTAYTEPTEAPVSAPPVSRRLPNQPDRPLTPADCAVVSESIFKPNPYGPGRSYTPNHCTLISIFPEARTYTPKALHGGMRTTYRIDGAPKGQYTKLIVYDTFIAIRKHQRSDDDNDEIQAAPAPAQGIAKDMIRFWAEDAPGNRSGAKPGFMICEGEDPTELELSQLWQGQTEYFRYLVMMADEHAHNQRFTQITEDHRRALSWLGTEDRPWFKKITSVMFKSCPSCGEDIRLLATACRYCQQDLIKWYKAAGIEVTEERDPGVFAFNQELKARNEKVRQDAEAERVRLKTQMTSKYGPRGTENRKEEAPAQAIVQTPVDLGEDPGPAQE